MKNSISLALITCFSFIGIGTLIRHGKNLSKDLSSVRAENQALKAEVSGYKSERIRIAKAVLASESFHLIEPSVTKMRFTGFNGELVWFTGESGISYSQLIPKNDPGVEIHDGKSVSVPEHATAFMLKGSSTDGWKVTMETSH